MIERLQSLSALKQFLGAIVGVFVAIACYYYFVAPVMWQVQLDHATAVEVRRLWQQQAAQQPRK